MEEMAVDTDQELTAVDEHIKFYHDQHQQEINALKKRQSNGETTVQRDIDTLNTKGEILQQELNAWKITTTRNMDGLIPQVHWLTTETGLLARSLPGIREELDWRRLACEGLFAENRERKAVAEKLEMQNRDLRKNIESLQSQVKSLEETTQVHGIDLTHLERGNKKTLTSLRREVKRLDYMAKKAQE